ncbi:hypothetical protein BLOT_006381 [Blomia tropicalis]|nr:hypothetical protein BLOT_006381 [Blomia tropicalis]
MLCGARPNRIMLCICCIGADLFTKPDADGDEKKRKIIKNPFGNDDLPHGFFGFVVLIVVIDCNYTAIDILINQMMKHIAIKHFYNSINLLLTFNNLHNYTSSRRGSQSVVLGLPEVWENE